MELQNEKSKLNVMTVRISSTLQVIDKGHETVNNFEAEVLYNEINIFFIKTLPAAEVWTSIAPPSLQ